MLQLLEIFLTLLPPDYLTHHNPMQVMGRRQGGGARGDEGRLGETAISQTPLWRAVCALQVRLERLRYISFAIHTINVHTLLHTTLGTN